MDFGVAAVVLGAQLIALAIFEGARLTRAAGAAVTIGSAPAGKLVRIVGRIVDGGSLVSPITGRACVAYDAIVLERERKGFSVVTRGVRGTPFIVDDGTGKILVDPRGAFVQVVYDTSEDGPLDFAKVSDPDLLAAVKDRTGQLRFDEGVLTIGEQVAVTGLVSKASGADEDSVYRRLAPTELRLAGAPDRPAVVSERPEDL